MAGLTDDDGCVHTGIDVRTDARSAPARASRARIVGVDVARGLALIGMMAAHILDGVDKSGHVTVIQQIVGGRAAALFAVLAGVSLALVTGGGQPHGGRALFATRVGVVVRAIIIGLIGLSIGGLDSRVAVILTYYAVLFVLATPFLGLGWRRLALLAGIWAVAAPIASYLIRPHLPAFDYSVPSFESLAHPGQLIAALTFTGYYPTVPWLAYVLAGLAMGQIALSAPRIAARIAVIGASIAFVAWGMSHFILHTGGFERLVATLPPNARVFGLPLQVTLVHGFYGNTPTTSWWWQAVVSPHSTTPFDLFQTIGSAMFVIGICVLAGLMWPRVLAVIFGAGTMTLTLYTAHVIALGEHWGYPPGSELYAWYVAIALLIGAVWRTAIGSGPLEWLTTYISRAAADAIRGRPLAPSADIEARAGPVVP